MKPFAGRKANEELARRLRCAAAKLEAKPIPSCSAIRDEVGIAESQVYARLFCPDGLGAFGFWLHRATIYPDYGFYLHEIEDWRVLAVCFAAAMAETGDLL